VSNLVSEKLLAGFPQNLFDVRYLPHGMLTGKYHKEKKAAACATALVD
jgi:hypothetical protein